jgi:uncharacterized membrane protein YfcA
VFLGVTLLIYAVTALASLHIKVQKAHEPWLGPIIGAVTGIITAATGVFMIPSVPYLQAIGFEKEGLVQALGLTFTIATVALSVNLALAGALKIALAGPTLGVLAVEGLGMWAGQELRLRLSPETFRRWFLIGLALLGAYLTVTALIRTRPAKPSPHRKIEVSVGERLRRQREVPPFLVVVAKALAAHCPDQEHAVGVLFGTDARIGGP